MAVLHHYPMNSPNVLTKTRTSAHTFPHLRNAIVRIPRAHAQLLSVQPGVVLDNSSEQAAIARPAWDQAQKPQQQ
eukprot:615311-Amphidinium_carterae.1